MPKQIYELDDEDLDQVVGGVMTEYVKNCPYFMQAVGKGSDNCCENCFNKVSDGNEEYCTKK